MFEGGFLGLDNITVVDRSEKLPGGAILEQSDATGWMGFFCLYMMRIALELAKENKAYEGLATKFFEHYIYIGAAMKKMGGRDYQLWDEKDGFFYDVLRYPNGEFHKFRVRSLVGLIPMFAVEVLRGEEISAHPDFLRDINWFIKNRSELVGHACEIWTEGGLTVSLYRLSIAINSVESSSGCGTRTSFYRLPESAACRNSTKNIHLSSVKAKCVMNRPRKT